MGSNFQYEGTLEETALSEMFYTIYHHRVPGEIRISRDGIVKRIYINDGNVVHASSTDRSDSLGAHLYRLGKLSRKELVETMRIREETGNKRYGEILIEGNMMSPRELFEAIRSQMESILWSVFAWRTGELRFAIGSNAAAQGIKIHLPMRQVILRCVEHLPDTRALVERLGRKRTVFVPRYETEELIQIALSAEEYQLLRLIDGERTLFQICNEGPYRVSENARLLYAFHVLRLIERADDARRSDSGPVKIRLPTKPPAM